MSEKIELEESEVEESEVLNGLIVKKNSSLKELIKFSLEERRLFDFCLQYYDSRENASNPTEFNVPIQEFRNSFPQYKKYKPIDFFNLCMKTANGIQSKPFRPTKYEAIYWFERLKLSEDQSEIYFSLTTHIMPFFLNLRRHYISYHRTDVYKFNKPASWTLYEYLKERFQNGQRPDWKTTISELRERLCADSKYPRFTDFDLYCIRRPKKEIDEHSDIYFKYLKIKKGRTVEFIKFEVFQKCVDPSVIDIEDQVKIFKRELLTAGINIKVAERYIKLATNQGKVSTILNEIPKMKKSWKKHGKKPWPAYLSGILQKELMEPNMFEDHDQKKKEKANKSIQEFEKMTDGDLRTLSETGNIYAKKVLAERKAKK